MIHDDTTISFTNLDVMTSWSSYNKNRQQHQQQDEQQREDVQSNSNKEQTSGNRLVSGDGDGKKRKRETGNIGKNRRLKEMSDFIQVSLQSTILDNKNGEEETKKAKLVNPFLNAIDQFKPRPIQTNIVLTTLLDPPLLTQWIPGLDTFIAYDDDEDQEICPNDSDGVYCSLDENDHGSNINMIRDLIDSLLHQHIISSDFVQQLESIGAKEANIQKDNTEKKSNDSNIENRLHRNNQELNKLSYENWLQIIPSDLFQHKLKSTFSQSLDQNVYKQHHATNEHRVLYKKLNLDLKKTLSISILLKLALICKSTSFAIHVCKNLLPAAISYSHKCDSEMPTMEDFNDSTKAEKESGNGDINLDQANHQNKVSLLKELARVLVTKCNLGTFTKQKLRQLTQNFVTMTTTMQQSDNEGNVEHKGNLQGCDPVKEFTRSLAEEYYHFHRLLK